MTVKWSDISLSDVFAVNRRLTLASFHNWQDDIATWAMAQKKDCAKYEQMMTEIESNWQLYGTDVQELYDTVSLCYLLLDGQMLGVNTKEEIQKLQEKRCSGK